MEEIRDEGEEGEGNALYLVIFIERVREARGVTVVAGKGQRFSANIS